MSYKFVIKAAMYFQYGCGNFFSGYEKLLVAYYDLVLIPNLDIQSKEKPSCKQKLELVLPF